MLHAVENYVNVHSKFLFGNCDESHVRWKKRHCSQQLNLEDNEQVFMLILTMVCFIFVLRSRLKSGDTSCSTKIEILCKWLRVVKDSILSFSLGIKRKFPEMIWGMRVESRFEMVINYEVQYSFFPSTLQPSDMFIFQLSTKNLNCHLFLSLVFT